EIYDGNKGKFLKNFEGFVEKCWEKKQQVLLVVDEAHLLPIELIEEIRLLSNQDQHILSIFLVGQPELNEYLDQKRLLPLRQRITLSFNLEPYPSGETEYYIRLRLLRAGGQQLDLFTDEAIELIHKLSKGIPRAINVLCDRALMTGLAENKRVITEDVICECAKELQLFMPEVRGQELNGRNGVWGRLKSVLSC
ncbi:MAG: AAA family ATPase, partial [Proteobacteria bacterium]|nr:AAA family ATPase [Pseudomonadota bacterium]